MEIFIEYNIVSINEVRSKLTKFVLFLGLILIGSIILSGAVSAATQGTSHNIIVPTKNLTVSHMEAVNSQTKIQSQTKIKTSNTLDTKKNQTLPDPTVIHLGVSTHYGTIALAIANAQDGDTIMLEDGATFYEHDLTIDKNLDFKVFSNGHATIDGENHRVFTINSGLIVYLQNLTIQNGKPATSVGGAIYNKGFILTVTNCNFIDNTVTDVGGAIENDGGALTVTNCTFIDNTATRGGAIFNELGVLTVTNSTFIDNHATISDGGAIYNNVGTCAIRGSSFTYNYATNNGGAIYNTGTLNVIGSSTFTSNRAINGGAISNIGAMTVMGITFNDDTAIRGGAIYNTGGTSATPVTISGCTFIINHATGNYGGAIFNDYGTLTVNNCNFTGNTAAFGGAIISDGGTLTVIGSTFNGNNATNEGGAIISDAGTCTVKGKSTFNGNTATNGGGAILNYDYSTLNVTGSTFTSNHADAGGAIANTGTLNVTSCTFKSNTAEAGGAIVNSGSGIANIHFNRIIGNTASKGSAIYNSGTADATINWWGSNANPIGNVYSTAPIIITPYLVLKVTANPIIIPNGGYSIITADLTHDNTNTHQTGGYVPDGIPVTITTTLGAMGIPSSMVNGVSHATLYARTVSGPATLTAKIDDQTLHTLLTIKDTIPPTAKASLKSGLYSTNKVITLSMSEHGTIFYTFNGSTPTKKSTKYKGPITISKTTILKYLAVDLAGNKSPVYSQIYKIDKIPPKVIKTIPTNNMTNVSRTSNIVIKFSENIKSNIYYNKITVKNMSTGKYVTVTKAISSNTLSIKNSKRTVNTWYLVTIPKAAIKDYAGNNLAANYTFKFKTGT